MCYNIYDVILFAAIYSKDGRKIMNIPNLEQDLEFYRLFEKLVSAMTDIKHTNVPLIEELLGKISTMLRLCKGVTRLYRNPREEAEGAGETLKSFDLGIEGELVHTVRVVTSVMSIAEMKVYMAPGQKPLNDYEFGKLDLVMRTTVSFVSRNRLRDIVEELAFHDDNGYRNFRSLGNYIMKNYTAGNISQYAMVAYNLIHFSLVNKQIGRDRADVVMKKHYDGMAALLGDMGSVSRLGGDNFILMCDQRKLEDVLLYLAGTDIEYEPHNHSCANISASVGIDCMPEGLVLNEPGDALENVMTAFRMAQSAVKGRTIFFDESLKQERQRSLHIQQLFASALEAEEFMVYYQPKVNVFTGEISGAEALCRWIHNGKLVHPADFIPILERSNDICLLDFYMLDHVCRDLRRWIDEGRRVVRVSVNLSRKHMMDSNLLNTILGIIDKNNVPHNYIEIELTETTTDVEFRDLRRVVGGLQQANIYTSVDDFGIGYSSLNLIRVIPWNVLKVDRSFLPDAEEDKNSNNSIMFTYVLAMAKAMGLECIVEGVETASQLVMLRENNCDLAQGYLFDRPLPVDEFEDRLNKRFYQIST